MMLRCFIAAACVAALSAASPSFSGVAHVVDGDTIIVGSQKIRLEGIDAPEMDQVCWLPNGDPWTCGLTSRAFLHVAVEGKHVQCYPSAHDRYNRVVATCFNTAGDVGEWMVVLGMAEAYRQYSTRYVSFEDLARQDRRGIWSGKHSSPSEWRRRYKHSDQQ